MRRRAFGPPGSAQSVRCSFTIRAKHACICGWFWSLVWLGAFFSRMRSPRPWKLVLYALSLIAIVYSHPLGLLMVGALGLASFLFRQAFQDLVAGLVVHPSCRCLAIVALGGPVPGPRSGINQRAAPTSVFARNADRVYRGELHSLARLLAVDRVWSLRGSLAKTWRHPDRFDAPGPVDFPFDLAGAFLRCFCTPIPVLAHPIFGPPRYTLFVGPAYLVLVARGLGKLPWPLAITAAAGGAILSGVMLLNDVYRPDLKADWKDVAAYLNQRDPGAVVAVISADLSGNTELETARYYFGPGRVVIPWSGQPGDLMSRQGSVWVSIGLRDGQPMGELPAVLTNGQTHSRGCRLLEASPDEGRFSPSFTSWGMIGAGHLTGETGFARHNTSVVTSPRPPTGPR